MAHVAQLVAGESSAEVSLGVAPSDSESSGAASGGCAPSASPGTGSCGAGAELSSSDPDGSPEVSDPVSESGAEVASSGGTELCSGSWTGGATRA